MTAERLAPDAVTLTNLSGVVANIQDDPDSPDGNWLVATGNNVGTTAEVTFPTPSGSLTTGAGLQEIRVLCRKFSATQTGTPTARIDIYENGTLVSSGSAVNITSAVGQVISRTFDASILSDQTGASFEVRAVGVQTGGSPGVRNTVDFGAIEWNVDYTAGSALTYSTTDPAGLVDAVTFEFSVTFTDPVGITQSGVVEENLDRNALGLTDSITAELSAGSTDQTFTVTDPLGLLDAVAAVRSAAVTNDDPVGLVDSVSSAAAKAVTVTDPVGLVDATALERTIPLTDPAGLLDSIIAALSVAVSITDPVGVTDSIAPARAVTITDPVGATDSISQVSDLSFTVTDTEGGTDTATSVGIYERIISDPEGLVDDVSSTLSFTVNDTLGAGDSITATFDLTFTVSDTVGGSDATSQVLELARTIVDNLDASDLAERFAELDRTISDLIGVADDIEAVSSGPLTQLRIYLTGRAPDMTVAGTEPATAIHGREPAHTLTGRRPVSSLTGREPVLVLVGEEQGQ